MKPKGIAVIVGVAVVILAVVFLPIKPNGVPPGIQDDAKVDENISVGLGSTPEDVDVDEGASISVSSTSEDTPAVTESVTMENQTSITYYTNEQGVKYYIDVNGTKHYVMSATDVPNVGEN